MAFLLRSVRESDLKDIEYLSSQFTLLNLPSEPQTLMNKIRNSIASFGGEHSTNSVYLFVAEDVESKKVVGCSQIIAKHGTEESPHVYFKILKKEKYSQDLGIGFIHQILRYNEDTDGPTEIGGLLVNPDYRKRSEKVGKQISLIRFAFLGIKQDLFEDRILCEFAPPLTAEGRSEFWEALGRRFTGLPYQEADRLSHKHKEFIKSLFPEEDIYTCLLSANARTTLGRVAEATRPAQHMLEKLGFKYLNEVDPFDGGPHFGVMTKEVSLITQGKQLPLSGESSAGYSMQGMVGYIKDGEFLGCQTAYEIKNNELCLPETSIKIIKSEVGQSLYLIPWE